MRETPEAQAPDVECPRSPDGRHHWDAITRHQDTTEHRLCAYCLRELLMPDKQPPDFYKIALELLANGSDESAIAEQLRLMWNARGAADIAAVDAKFPHVTLITQPFIDALRALDR